MRYYYEKPLRAVCSFTPMERNGFAKDINSRGRVCHEGDGLSFESNARETLSLTANSLAATVSQGRYPARRYKDVMESLPHGGALGHFSEDTTRFPPLRPGAPPDSWVDGLKYNGIFTVRWPNLSLSEPRVFTFD
ncbi:hypothetical protein Hypma_001315 [Hypsizygus marmoreus]|uniref:Uncharacterized protein n=1 Tax=Hypsizygus marmoreus TaxID=39966 RepID=A0A369K6F5_HYPMA|nr:hypothetical protein Hypma_001315 [Hypsizygus marmoreus]